MHFAQISEKDGSLRVYWNAESALPVRVERAIEEFVWLAEARSACTCMTCGDEGRLFSSRGLLLTACTRHAHGKPVPNHRGFENIHIVRELVREDIAVCVYRRYDRKLDAFVEVDLRSLGIEVQS
jgi:hypothetical protein